MSVHILGTYDHKPQPGTFDVRVEGDRVLVPNSLAPVLAELSISTAERLISYLYTYPTIFRQHLNGRRSAEDAWSADDIVKARHLLFNQLRSVIGRELLDAIVSPPRFALGARKPFSDGNS